MCENKRERKAERKLVREEKAVVRMSTDEISSSIRNALSANANEFPIGRTNLGTIVATRKFTKPINPDHCPHDPAEETFLILARYAVDMSIAVAVICLPQEQHEPVYLRPVMAVFPEEPIEIHIDELVVVTRFTEIVEELRSAATIAAA